ncbi:hypothetical protein ABZY58_11380 [Micromonospora tulbaghiae]|uniref:hypothetical protein n=1 Tax=Micromonospora tulbaghiae TaxID=479978 RepID=UPI0033AC6F72
MTRDEALAALAELSDEAVHRRRVAAVVDALNADPPATWEQIGAALGGKAGSNTNRKYRPLVEQVGRTRYRTKPDITS